MRQERSIGRDSVVTSYERDESRVLVEALDGIDAESAGVLVEEQIVTIEALYSNSFSPYPGEISSAVRCAKEYAPVVVRDVGDTSHYGYALVYATARHGLGACTRDTVAYRMLVGWLYCRRASTLHTVRYLVPLSPMPDDRESTYTRMSCRSPEE